MDGYNWDTLGLRPSALKKWEPILDYSPDGRPSDAGFFVDVKENGDVIWALKVRGLGVVTLRAIVYRGRSVFKGIATFTAHEMQSGRLAA